MKELLTTIILKHSNIADITEQILTRNIVKLQEKSIKQEKFN